MKGERQRLLGKQPAKTQSMRGNLRWLVGLAIQVMVPSDIHKQIALIGVENGASIRTVVLRG
jgi:hypothetical protein